MRRLLHLFRLRRSWRELKLTWRLVRDRRVAWYLKLIPLAAAAYVIWPLDLIPGFLVFLGLVDDVAIALLGLGLFRSLVPGWLVAEHERELQLRR